MDETRRPALGGSPPLAVARWLLLGAPPSSFVRASRPRERDHDLASRQTSPDLWLETQASLGARGRLPRRDRSRGSGAVGMPFQAAGHAPGREVTDELGQRAAL